MPEKLKMRSSDLVAGNIDKIAELFPNCVTEAAGDGGEITRKIDFDLLRQELSGEIVEGPLERYHLNWPGKREAMLAANAPIAKTLRPCREESVDFDTTRNLFIEGDNLEALKLLQETYLGKVKMIYIDPPYNKDCEYLYNDKFSSTAADYLSQSEQRDSDELLVTNSEANGRFHSNWLSMMLPRLKLAKQVLSDTGVIAISIDDSELHNLRKLCDEVFGATNFIACLVWEKGRKNDAKLFSLGHEYILVYARSKQRLKDLGTTWREEKPGAREIWDHYLELRSELLNDDASVSERLGEWFSNLPRGNPSKKWSRYRRVDANGPWRDRDISWPGGDGPRYDVIHPKTETPCKVPERGWGFSTIEEMNRQIKLGLVVFREDHTEPPFRKAHLRPVIGAGIETDECSDDEMSDDEAELATQVRGSYFYKQSQVTIREFRKLMGAKIFDNPKDPDELASLVEYFTKEDPECHVVDFFAGSGSFADAVARVNARSNGTRRFTVVQMPEPFHESSKVFKQASAFCDKHNLPRTISAIAKVRITRSLKIDGLLPKAKGFRVMKIDSSNMKDVYYSPADTSQAMLTDLIDNIKPERSGEDLLFQVLLDCGVDLGLPIRCEKIDDHEVFFVNDSEHAAPDLIACFDADVPDSLVKTVAARTPLRAVFRDHCFTADDAKINVEQIFKQMSPDTQLKSL